MDHWCLIGVLTDQQYTMAIYLSAYSQYIISRYQQCQSQMKNKTLNISLCVSQVQKAKPIIYNCRKPICTICLNADLRSSTNCSPLWVFSIWLVFMCWQTRCESDVQEVCNHSTANQSLGNHSISFYFGLCLQPHSN